MPQGKIILARMVGMMAGDVAEPCAQDGKRVIIMQLQDQSTGKLLPPIGFTFEGLNDLLMAMTDTLDKEDARERQLEAGGQIE